MKYMGSKSRIAKYIVPIIQSYIDKVTPDMFLDLFVGGANIIDKINYKSKYGSDINEQLIELLRHVQSGKSLPDAIPREEYNLVREEYYTTVNMPFAEYVPKYEHWYIGCVGFLASYNGRNFDGGYAKSGYEKTKNGERFRDYYNESKNNLLKQASSDLFKDINFGICDYRDYIDSKYIQNCVIYCDPPYKNTKQYDNSDNFDHNEFWEKMNKLSKDNIVLVSELEAPEDWVCIWEKEVSRSIKSQDKSKAVEKLFIHKNNI